MRLPAHLPCNASVSSPSSQRCSSSSPSPADGSTLKVLLPKKALLSLLALAQKHKPRVLRFSHAPRQSLRIPCIASQCLEIQTQPTWMCNFALLLPQLLLHQGWRAHFRREALAEPGGNGQPMTRGSQGHSQWVLKSSWSSGHLYEFPNSRRLKATDCMLFLLKNLLFLLISLLKNLHKLQN